MSRKAKKVVVAPKWLSRRHDKELLKLFKLKYKTRGGLKSKDISPGKLRK